MTAYSLNVLLVEDQRLIQKATSRLLSKFNFKVSIASTGAQALEMAKDNNYDLILMDIGLPDYDGLTVTSEIRQINTSVPIIGLTAQELTEDEYSNCGMNDLIIKPLSTEKVLRVVYYNIK